MSDLKIAVQPTKTLEFTPNQLIIRVVNQDIVTGMSLVYFELRDFNLDNSRYETRDWIDKGTVWMPTQALLDAVDNSDPNNPIINEAYTDQLLAAFNLEITSIYPLK